MGLIKTAIMTGGGIYAVKQLAASQNHRYSNRNDNYDSQQQRDYNQDHGMPQQQQQQQQYYNPPPPQGYWGPPALGQEHLGPVWYPYPPGPPANFGNGGGTSGNGQGGVSQRGGDGGRVGEQSWVSDGGVGAGRGGNDGELPVYERWNGGKN